MMERWFKLKTLLGSSIHSSLLSSLSCTEQGDVFASHSHGFLQTLVIEKTCRLLPKTLLFKSDFTVPLCDLSNWASLAIRLDKFCTWLLGRKDRASFFKPAFAISVHYVVMVTINCLAFKVPILDTNIHESQSHYRGKKGGFACKMFMFGFI